jgi:hypothetical protein
LAQGKWIAFIDSVFRVLGSGAVWPEVIRMHAGVARSAADSKRRAVLRPPEQQHLLKTAICKEQFQVHLVQ